MTCVKWGPTAITARRAAECAKGSAVGPSNNSAMTPRYAKMIRDAERRAPADASLLTALIAMALAPLPGMLLGAPAAPAMMLRTLVSAAPVFALPPFLLGGGLGTLMHLAMTARERAAAAGIGTHALVSPPSLIASSLLVASVFASVGFTLAAALSLAA